jgi:isochorismate synthase
MKDQFFSLFSQESTGLLVAPPGTSSPFFIPNAGVLSRPFGLKKKSHLYPILSHPDYLELIAQATHAMQDGKGEKVVLSRCISGPKLDAEKAWVLFESWLQSYPQAYVFIWNDEQQGRWMGASPETLVTIEQGKVSTMALAGSKDKEDFSPWKDKEKLEHEVVVQYIQRIFSSAGATQVVVEDTVSFSAGAVKHLLTPIHALSQESLAFWVDQLHPTPALCGLPKAWAMNYIHEHEPHDRGMYGGVLGFQFLQKEAAFVVLRCMHILPNNDTVIFVGGGIMPDSSPEKEWEETQWKANSIMLSSRPDETFQ